MSATLGVSDDVIDKAWTVPMTLLIVLAVKGLMTMMQSSRAEASTPVEVSPSSKSGEPTSGKVGKDPSEASAPTKTKGPLEGVYNGYTQGPRTSDDTYTLHRCYDARCSRGTNSCRCCASHGPTAAP